MFPRLGNLTEHLRNAEVASAIVYGVWLFGTLSVVFVTLRYGRHFPYSDDWAVLSLLTGNAEDVLAALWQQHNEHRILIPKLIWMVLFKLSEGDYRCLSLLNSLLASGAAFVMIGAARQLRGHLRITDGFFPLLFLHLGNNIHWWSFMTEFTLSMFLLVLILRLSIMLTSNNGQARSLLFAWGICACLVLLPLCGLNGLVPAFVLAVGFIALPRIDRTWAAASPKAAQILRLGGVVCLTLVGITFIEYQFPDHPSTERTILNVLYVTARTIASPFGQHPASIWIPGLVLILTASIGAVWVARTNLRLDRSTQLLTFIGFAASLLILAATVGWGRSWRSWHPWLEVHYAALEMPLLSCLYLFYVRFGPHWVQRTVQMSLAGAFIIVFSIQLPAGFDRGRWEEAKNLEVDRDLLGGASAESIANKHISTLYYRDTPYSRTVVRQGLVVLKRNGLIRYQRVQE